AGRAAELRTVALLGPVHGAVAAHRARGGLTHGRVEGAVARALERAAREALVGAGAPAELRAVALLGAVHDAVAAREARRRVELAGPAARDRAAVEALALAGRAAEL